MNLHEYQAKALFKDYGLPISRGVVCRSSDEAAAAIDTLGGDCWAIKCQVHAGGRGKAGGVRLVYNKSEACAFTEQWLGKNLVTFQTDKHGQPVNAIYLEETCNIASELYLGAVIDRSSRQIVFMASSAGGMNIEDVARETPHLIYKMPLDPLLGASAYQGRELAFKLGLRDEQNKQFTHIFTQLAKLFVEKDVSLLEINPLVVTQEGQLLCLDAKITIDDNALYRHKDLSALRDFTQSDIREAQAEQHIVKLYGGEPANFLDVGGGATKERVAEAFKIILTDKAVKAVLVNIFGGIVRCDLIAEGVIAAVNEVGVAVPVVVRLEGTNAELGRKILAQSNLNLIAANSLQEAAQAVVAAVKGE